MLTSKKQQAQETQAVLSNGRTAQLTPTDLCNFLNSCQSIGIKPDNFGIIIRVITDYVIDGADDYLSICELKKQLLFLQMLETFLSNLKIN